MNKIHEYFISINEPYAAGIFEEPDAPYMRRYCRAERRYWENCAIAGYSGGRLYPCGVRYISSFKVSPNYTVTFGADYGALPEEARQYLNSLPQPTYVSSPHTVGGNGYIHSIPHYSRVAHEGLNSYQRRVDYASDENFKLAMTDVITGIRSYHTRVLTYLKDVNANADLITALEQVPFEPARSLYEAIVCWNFVYYLDGCDNPGRLDADLIAWYKGEDVTDLLHDMFENVDINEGWTGALGPNYNPLTYQCLKAIKGMRRPSLELRVCENMPDDLWDLAEETVKSGGGQPSFYNEPLYQESLHKKFPDKPLADLKRFCGGGCTESMLAGISNVGSLDAGVNLVYILRNYMVEKLAVCDDFDSFYDGYIAEATAVIEKTLDEVSRLQRERAMYKAQPMRTLLIDDCIENEADFLNGGARHYWSVINVAGLINVIDSMLAIREVVYVKKLYDKAELVKMLDNGEKIRSEAAYGRDDAESDELAGDLATKIYNAFERRTPYLGGSFLPSSIQFATFADAGKGIGATPDGREENGALCDSLAAIHGNDTKSCLAMLRSAAALPLYKALGTPVLNLKLNKAHVNGHLRSIVKGFFSLGGMQLQITCQSREDMLDALVHPENHQRLVVRIGGYSEYFNRLTDELKHAVINRTEY